MEYDVYFDESGDLGWTLQQPYRNGGSSKYFVIAYLILPTQKAKLITRFIKKFHKDRKGKEREIKGATFRNARTKSISRKMIELFRANSDFSIGAVIVKKTNAPIRLISSGNDDVLYNHMVQVGICDKLINCTKVNIIPDRKSVPRGSQNSCSDLIKGKLWLELDSSVEISYQPQESHHNQKLIFIDWIANFVWRNYENKNADAYLTLKPFLEEQLLFF